MSCPFLKLILRFFWFLAKIVDWISCILMAGVLVLTVSNVFLRYLMSSPVKWYEEVVLMLFVWLIMLGIGAAYRYGSLMYIDILDSVLSQRALNIFQVFVDIFISLIMGALIVYGLQFSIQAFVKVTDILRIPYFYIDVAIPIGSALCIKDICAKYIARLGNYQEAFHGN